MKVALVYDRVNKWGGAERVLLALAELFPDAPLYTSVYNKKTARWAKPFDVRSTFLQKIPFASSSHEQFALFMPVAFESFHFDDYDVVISITSEHAKSILTKPQTLHICYCLTPTRYLWSGYQDYFKNSLLRFLSHPAIAYLKTFDTIASNRPDFYIAISQAVQERIKNYYQKDSSVVYPALTLASRSVSLEEKKLNSPLKVALGDTHWRAGERSSYFLIVSRFVPYKRLDIAIEACNMLKLPLIIVGKGSEEGALRRIAGPTVTFVGTLTDEELLEYYRNCKALIIPANEDFGLTALEVQAQGKPVIALKSGGVLETVIEGKTGAFFYPQNAHALITALKNFDTFHFDRKDCIQQARKFGTEQFKKAFMAQLQTYIKEYKKNL
ncbi:MAG TPA: glycosyltransferase [Candidatus Saccharimonadales bacterium]|nr:glycosyltransferase [Candidatus Saccharimonadales bacterium]